MHQVFNISLRALDGRIFQSQHMKTQPPCKRNNLSDNLQMHVFITHHAFFADLFPSGFKLRLNQADHFPLLL